MRRFRRVCAAAAVTAAAMTGCGGSDAGGSTEDRTSGRATTASSGGAQAPARTGRVKLTKLADLDAPVGMTVRRGDQALYVIEQPGRVRAIRDGRLDPEPVLDLRADLTSGGERGLLGIAFSPDGRHLYLDYTDKSGHTHVTEWAVGRDGEVDRGSRREVLFQKQPYANHNGGQLAFGPDGHLYIAFGDGGSGGDPQGNGQNLGTWLGKILRIAPRPAGGKAYGVPRDNPFVNRRGAKPEIWAYGLRNPWRFSFDSVTGDLWIGDVGQDGWEEVDRQPGRSKGGENYGWNAREGRHRFKGDRPADAVDPVLEYPLHKDGACSVIGGHVYRGRKLAGLTGHYVYGDYCAGWVKEVPVGPSGPENTADPRTLLTGVGQLSAFGVDQAGELYVLSLNGPVYRIDVA
ncbi:PQQ-dependent sugar dehydrogenase [Actinomadura alba]|uniref:PQQ-dependent sugar dehydrogenase n=1 Tax=Actinomadura alba TaxID=406431 RepID=A0ABR7LT24_9ACTN|nr:PQQ-dependent sugar dehydrogenase [Actinomadura alba]MBC6468005.1 PQQ-dependent sugar dehydrogenase [Actinomadura alba]